MLRAVIAGIDDAIFAKDRSGRYLLVNSAGARRVGRAVEDILGRDDTELFDPETSRRIRDDDLRIMREAITLTREETGQAAGVTRVYLATKWPNRDAQGRIIGVLGISRDVTDARRSAIATPGELTRGSIDARSQSRIPSRPDHRRRPDVHAGPPGSTRRRPRPDPRQCRNPDPTRSGDAPLGG